MLVLAGACWQLLGKTSPQGARYLGRMKAEEIKESSGVARSTRYPDVLWTHNDSGNPEILFAIKRDGTLLGKWPVTGARLVDWEDMAFDGRGNLLLADTGDNRRTRTQIRIHRVKEPDPHRHQGDVPVEHSWVLQHPNGPRDVEGLFVIGNDGFLITKRAEATAEIYRFSLDPSVTSQTLQLVTEIDVGSPLTGAAISADKNWIALVAHGAAFAYQIDGDVTRARGEATHAIRFKKRRIEGCTFVPEGLLATAETGRIYLFTNQIFVTRGG